MTEMTPLQVLREALHARAAGWWRVAEDSLELLAFCAAEDMPAEVAEGFAAATRRVPLSQANLGIVRAVLTGTPAISIVSELSSSEGSGLWLRRFAATRSVAVPLRDEAGRVARVVSVALDETLPAMIIARLIRVTASAWLELPTAE